jgi:CRISPR-associated protein Cas2
MLIWVVYDIASTRLRTKLAETCLNYGLRRVQKSTFFGYLDRKATQRLEKELSNHFKRASNVAPTDSVIALPMCKACFEKRVVVGKTNAELTNEQPAFVMF